MGRITVYIHPTCMSSYKLIKQLHLEGLLSKVGVRNTSRGAEAMERKIYSVPWVLMGDNPVATDPVSAGEIKELILSGSISVKSSPRDLFVNSIISSAFMAAQVLLRKDVRVALEREFLEAALRSRVGGYEPRVVVEDVTGKGGELYETLEPFLARSLAYSYVRELLWAKGLGSEPDFDIVSRKEIVGSWILAKASIGRAFLPNKPVIVGHSGVEAIAEIVLEKGEAIARSIREEQETIMRDEEYWNILESLGVLGG